MKEERQTSLIPRYFPRFQCKMGACRSCCCVGWPVTVSMKDYFTLLGVSCRKELRDKLDCALRVVEHPTKEEYARFSPNWLGDCPMRMEDGRCSIHAELGGDMLSDVCRLYPRGVRRFGRRYECSASNSCEMTLELLWDEQEPMTFEESPLPVTPPPVPGSPVPTDGLPLTEEYRFSLICAMQERSLTVSERIRTLRPLMGLDAGGMGEVGVSLALSALRYYVGNSDSIREPGLEALGRYEVFPGLYGTDAETFGERFPDWEIFFEQMLVNHMFYAQFPYFGISCGDAWRSLALIYALLRLLLTGCAAAAEERGEAFGKEAFIDLSASAFRLISHTHFERSVTASLGESDGVCLLNL